MKVTIKIISVFFLSILFSLKASAQEELTASEQLNFGVNLGNYKMVEQALSRGAIIELDQVVAAISLINFPDGKEADHKAILKLVLNKAVNINGVSKNDETVLTSLAKSYPYDQKAESPLEIAQLLINKGLNVNEANKEGRTALTILCDADIFMEMEHRLSFANLLLKNGADIEFQSNEHMTSGGTPLINAASNGYLELTALLLDKGANPNAQNDVGETALVKVIKAKQTAVSNEDKKRTIHLLLSKGANPNNKNSFGESALEIAKFENLSFLFDPPQKSSLATTSLKQQMLAVPGWGTVNANKALEIFLMQGDLEGVKNAVDAGADVNMITDEGGRYGSTSALGKASSLLCGRNNLLIVTYLLDKGAKINVNGAGSALYNATSMASMIYSEKFKAKFFPDYLLSQENVVYGNRYNEFLEIIKFLLQKGIKVDGDITNGRGNTPLMEATNNGCLEIVKLLLLNGADVKIKAVEDYQLISGAAGYIYTWSLAAGTFALKGRQALGIQIENAAHFEGEISDIKKDQAKWIEAFSEYTEIMKLLIAKGANVNVNYKSITPLQQAQAYHLAPMINMLKSAGAR